MEMARVQTILGLEWNRRFNCADDADDTDAKEPNPSGLWIRDCVYRACYCLPDFGRWHTESAGRFGKPAARFYQDAKRYNGSNAAWGFFGLAKEHANKLRVVAAIDAGSDLMSNPACP